MRGIQNCFSVCPLVKTNGMYKHFKRCSKWNGRNFNRWDFTKGHEGRELGCEGTEVPDQNQLQVKKFVF